MERPNTMEERIAIANAAIVTQKAVTAFNDLPRDFKGVTIKENTITILATRRHLYAYANQFEVSLGLSLRKWRATDVATNLQTCFPACDALDCKYLEDVLSNLQLTKRWSQNIVLSGPGERFTENALEVTHWISHQRFQSN